MATKKTKVFKPNKVSTPNAYNDKLGIKKSSHIPKSVIKNCKYYGGYMTKCYREWTDVNNLLKGKKAQCGSTKGNQGGEVRHIGGPTGTYPQPALLHFYDFDKDFLDENSKIHDITVSFSYRVLNVTASGKPWTNNLISSELAIIQGVDAWIGSADQKKLFSDITHNKTKFKYEFKNKNNEYIWKTVTLTIKDVDASKISSKDFALNLQFGYNCSVAQTPCILYISKLSTSITYESAKKYIKGSNSSNNIYTSAESVCRNSITQTIEAGYKKNNKVIAPKDAPAKLGPKIKLCSAPNNVSVTQKSSTDSTKTFTIIDNSNIAGEKTITYCLSDDTNTKVSLKYTALIRTKPKYNITDTYKANEDFNPSKPYIIFKNGCASHINIYIDNLNSNPLTFNIDTNRQNSSSNLLNTNQIQDFHDNIKELSCGFHQLFIQRGNESISDAKKNKVIIQITPMEYQFRVYDENNPTLEYLQSKANRYETIHIIRIDNEPREVIPEIAIFDDTNKTEDPVIISNVRKGVPFDHVIDKYYAGEFYIKAMDNQAICKSTNNIFATITVKSNHKQNYDYLFTRGEDGTPFDFDYLVAWEGDTVDEPINIGDIEFKHSPNDIRLCSQSMQTGLSQIGLIGLRVQNNTLNDTFKNVRIELNTLYQNDDGEFDVTTNEWTSQNGIFADFYNLFFDYNQALGSNIEIENLTPDNDLVDEENVYLLIHTINPGDSITIYLPYRSVAEKTVFLQYLLFEQPQTIYDFGNCTQQVKLEDMIQIDVVDSMLTQLDIIGNMDLLSLDQSFDCPTECYTTKENDNEQSGGITYKITNIDSNDFSNTTVITEILNSNELQPYGYYIDQTYYPLFDNNGEAIEVHDNPVRDIDGNIVYDDDNQPVYQQNRILWTQEKQVNPKPLVGQNVYCNIQFPAMEAQEIIQKTTKNGLAQFYIPIPSELNRSYTVKELLNEVLYFSFKGKNDYDKCLLAEEDNQNIPLYARDTNKSETIMIYGNDFRRYKPGENAYIPIFLSAKIESIQNKIIFNANLHNTGSYDAVRILYKICNINNNEGIFKTKFKTNDKLLIPNEIEKNIYCGIDTNIEVHTKLEKQVLESETINVIYVNVNNKIKDNKDVKIQFNLGQHPEENLVGDYSFIDINIDIGDYSLIQDDNNNTILTWLIGEMNAYQTNKGVITLKARNIGLSDIQVGIFDYIHQEGQDAIPIKNSKCPQCNKTYTFKDSPWKKFDNVWYKLIDGQYKRQVLIDNKLQWVNKDD